MIYPSKSLKYLQFINYNSYCSFVILMQDIIVKSSLELKKRRIWKTYKIRYSDILFIEFFHKIVTLQPRNVLLCGILFKERGVIYHLINMKRNFDILFNVVFSPHTTYRLILKDILLTIQYS